VFFSSSVAIVANKDTYKQQIQDCHQKWIGLLRLHQETTADLLYASVRPDECKGKDKGLDACYSATYMSQTHDQQRCTISEVAADWHEPMVPQRIIWPSIAHANGQLDPLGS